MSGFVVDAEAHHSNAKVEYAFYPARIDAGSAVPVGAAWVVIFAVGSGDGDYLPTHVFERLAKFSSTMNPSTQT